MAGSQGLLSFIKGTMLLLSYTPESGVFEDGVRRVYDEVTPRADATRAL